MLPDLDSLQVNQRKKPTEQSVGFMLIRYSFSQNHSRCCRGRSNSRLATCCPRGTRSPFPLLQGSLEPKLTPTQLVAQASPFPLLQGSLEPVLGIHVLAIPRLHSRCFRGRWNLN